jgi:hypothetical protein
MVQTWDIRTEELAPVSLKELIAFFDARGPYPLTKHDNDEAALMMSRVMLSRGSVCEYIVSTFDQLLAPGNDDYTPDAVVLHTSKDFFVRLVMWLPVDSSGIRRDITDSTVHDHNFTFMTLGLLGPGYDTEVWQYQYVPEGDQTGVTVDGHRQGILRLEEGKVFLFEKSVDIHSQLSPSAFSISLNIIETTNATNMQYDFVVANEKRDQLTMITLLNPPFVQQLCNVLHNSPLRAEAQNVVATSPLLAHQGLAGDVVQRALRQFGPQQPAA